MTRITQTLFYFTEDDFRENKPPARDLLIFARACDINSIKIQDQMFLKNGGVADPFYQRLRERAKFVLMECKEDFDGCFCCSVGANETDMHAMAFTFGDEEAWIEVRDEVFATNSSTPSRRTMSSASRKRTRSRSTIRRSTAWRWSLASRAIRCGRNSRARRRLRRLHRRLQHVHLLRDCRHRLR